MVLEMIPLLSGFIPQDISVLSKVVELFVCDVAAAKQEIGKVLVLRAIGGIELVGMEIEPGKNLLFWW